MSKMESEHAIDIVRRCGICDDICNQSVIPAHTCLEGYTNYIIDANTLCFYPVLASDQFRGNKKRKASEASSNSAMERIADAICHQTNDIVLPAPSQPDEIDSFLLMLGCRQRRMPLNKQLRIVQQILDLTYRVLLESENND